MQHTSLNEPGELYTALIDSQDFIKTVGDRVLNACTLLYYVRLSTEQFKFACLWITIGYGVMTRMCCVLLYLNYAARAH